MSTLEKVFKKDSLICKQGEDTDKLYFVQSGSLLVFGIDGTKVTPFATIGKNEFVGELSFFDNEKRSAYVMTTEDSSLVEITESNKKEDMPNWMLHLAKSLTTRMRFLDDSILKNGIKRRKAKTVSALSIDEQREILNLIK